MHIHIELREISNGVLVAAYPAGSVITDLASGAQFFPSWTAAMSDLPGIAAEALEQARERAPTDASATQSRAWRDGDTLAMAAERFEAQEPESGSSFSDDAQRAGFVIGDQSFDPESLRGS